MVLTSLTHLQITFIAVASTILALVLFLVIFIPLRRYYKKKQYREYYGKKVYDIAFSKDYYLINDFVFRLEDNKAGVIDHILFGDKYIYLINDFFYDGDLAGKIDDKSLIFVSKQGKKYYTDNPFIINSHLLNRLSLLTGIDKDMFIGLVLVNDYCNCAIASESKNFYIIQRKRLSALIKAIESRPIGNINPEQLESVVQSIAMLNRKKRK